MSSYNRARDDDKFIHTALAGSTPWLISGDKDLLDVPPIEGLRIVSPAQAAAQTARLGKDCNAALRFEGKYRPTLDD